MFVEKENQHKVEVEHKGGIGLCWVALAIFLGLIFAMPSKMQIDCFLDVQAACQTIAESYIK